MLCFENMVNSIRVDSSLWSFRLALRTILPNRSCRGRCWLVLDMVVLLASRICSLWFALLRADDYFDSRLGRSCLAEFVVDNSDYFQIGLTFLASRLCFVRSHCSVLMGISVHVQHDIAGICCRGWCQLLLDRVEIIWLRIHFYFDSPWFDHIIISIPAEDDLARLILSWAMLALFRQGGICFCLIMFNPIPAA